MWVTFEAYSYVFVKNYLIFYFILIQGHLIVYFIMLSPIYKFSISIGKL
jgi:hypothetical protein